MSNFQISRIRTYRAAPPIDGKAAAFSRESGDPVFIPAEDVLRFDLGQQFFAGQGLRDFGIPDEIVPVQRLKGKTALEQLLRIGGKGRAPGSLAVDFIGGDPVNPRLCGIRVAQLPEMPESLDESLLENVFGIVMVDDAPADVPIHRLVITVRQGLERQSFRFHLLL